MEVISVREHPERVEEAIAYFQEKWASEESKAIYDDCIRHSLTASGFLPQWYLLYQEEEIIGCTGVISNDFISRMDLYPWLCALYVEEKYRGHAYGKYLLERAKEDTRAAGYTRLYLCTDHVGYYEKYEFHYLAQGYHPWGESSRIYEAELLPYQQNETGLLK